MLYPLNADLENPEIIQFLHKYLDLIKKYNIITRENKNFRVFKAKVCYQNLKVGNLAVYTIANFKYIHEYNDFDYSHGSLDSICTINNQEKIDGALTKIDEKLPSKFNKQINFVLQTITDDLQKKHLQNLDNKFDDETANRVIVEFPFKNLIVNDSKNEKSQIENSDKQIKLTNINNRSFYFNRGQENDQKIAQHKGEVEKEKSVQTPKNRKYKDDKNPKILDLSTNLKPEIKISHLLSNMDNIFLKKQNFRPQIILKNILNARSLIFLLFVLSIAVNFGQGFFFGIMWAKKIMKIQNQRFSAVEFLQKSILSYNFILDTHIITNRKQYLIFLY